MAACLLADVGGMSILPDTLPDSCSGYILMTPAEYKANQSPFASFDLTVAIQVSAFELTMFILFYSAGLITRKLRR